MRVAIGDSHLEHADAGAVDDDLQRHRVGPEVVQHVLRVVQRQSPFAGIVVADLENHLLGLAADSPA